VYVEPSKFPNKHRAEDRLPPKSPQFTIDLSLVPSWLLPVSREGLRTVHPRTINKVDIKAPVILEEEGKTLFFGKAVENRWGRW